MPEKAAQKEPGKKPVPSKKPKPQQEVVVQISLSELHPFPDHPFQVREDASMQETAESVKEYGVLVPALARPREDGGYELIAGHRRKHACELAGLATMPVIVRDIDRDAATIIMVDSNLQRENILPSERAKAYKMKMEAIKRQGARTDLTSPKISAKFRSDDEVGQDAGVSGDTIRNYIALATCTNRGFKYTPAREMRVDLPFLELWSLRGQQPAHETRCFAEGNTDISAPISEISAMAVIMFPEKPRTV